MRGVLSQGATHDGLDRRREAYLLPVDGGRLIVDNGLEDTRQIATPKWPLTGQALVQDATERKQIGAAVHVFSTGLLRGHVVGRSYEASRRGEAARRLDLGNSKVSNFHLSGGGSHDVGRFDVPMDHFLLVRVVKSFGYLRQDVDSLGKVKALL